MPTPPHPIFDAVLLEMPIAVFDLETTGVSSSKDRIIQIAVVPVEAGAVSDEGWDQLVHPGDDHLPLSPFISDLTKITDADLVGQPSMAEVALEFDALVGEKVVAGHNVAAFDLRFMRKVEDRHQLELQTDYYVDTMRLMRKLHPDLENHRLPTCAAYYGLEVDEDGLHNALVDTKLTADLMLKQFEELSGKGVRTFEQMLGFLTA